MLEIISVSSGLRCPEDMEAKSQLRQLTRVYNPVLSEHSGLTEVS